MFLLRIILDWFNFIVAGKDNVIILTSFLSFFATLILVIVTNKYVKLTKSIAADNSKYLKITEEKEKIDRTLDYIAKFDLKRFTNLIYKKTDPFECYRKDPKKDIITLMAEHGEEINYFINYFDTVAILYFKNKLDTELFEIKIEPYILIFSISFEGTIIGRIENTKAIGDKIFYWEQNLLNLILKILDKNKNSGTIEFRERCVEILKNYIKCSE